MNNVVHSLFEPASELRARISERIQDFELLPRKSVEVLTMFVVLGTIYSFYLKAVWSIPACRNVELDPAYLLTLSKFVVLTGWPFALMAFLDDTWSSKDAGHVFLGAFVATNWFWMHRYHHRFCPYSFAFEIFPYVFSALVGNGIGAWTQRSRIEVEKYSL